MKPLLVAAIFFSAACARHDGNEAQHESLRKLGHDITKVVASAKNPDSVDDPTAFRYRVHQQVIPLRERLERIRQHTNTGVRTDGANDKDPTDKQMKDRDKVEAELNQMEEQLNQIDSPPAETPNAADRLAEDANRSSYWKRFGPYLAERQWGTVREDYSGDQNGWSYFPHAQAQSRAYRWGEDGLLGLADRQARLCFAPALWNGNDPCLKERLFGLTGPEGNHGEDVKELYYYLDATPTASYLKALYKYPHERFPYEKLLQEANDRKRDMRLPEYELIDTGCFERGYFDMLVQYAKADAEDILIRLSFTNR
ncbi:hypothetical protein FGG08_007644, partial [Glutinoglossum americanum]